MTEAVEHVIKPWWLMGLPEHMAASPVEKNDTEETEQIAQTLIDLQAQLAALTAKVGKLEESLTTPSSEEHAAN